MRYGSVCSGIEGATVAWKELGWKPAWYAEVDKFCCALLAKRYPEVENLGDITKIKSVPAIELLVGGTPCQSFSVQGLRKGMDDPRGNLLLRFCQIASFAHPRWIVWENVPGVLSSNGGRDFGSLIGALVKLGYGVAYRVLDSKYFGVAQRRKRVFVVANYRDWRRAAAVLFERPARKQDCDTPNEVPCKCERNSKRIASKALYGFTGDTTPKFGKEITPTLRAYQGGEGVGVIGENVFRRLMPVEWERLQGFHDDYTKIEGFSDKARTTALGNAFCVPVIKWIGERIAFVDVL